MQTILSPVALSWHSGPREIDYTCKGLFLTFESIPLSEFIPMPVPHRLDHCYFVEGFKLGSVDYLKLFSFKIVLAILAPLQFHMNFRISLLNFCKKS